MSPELKNLIELDRIAQEIARLTDEIAQLPKVVAAIEAKLARARAQVESATKALKDQESQKRKLESDIQDWQQKISKFRDQSLSVKTNEQYKALMHEIEFAQKQISDCEEQILIGMEGADSYHKALKDEAELKLETAEIEKEKEHARKVTAEDEAKLAELRKQQAELRSQIDDATLAHFERVSAKRKGAIAEAIDQKCAACNVMMRPQRFNELLAGQSLVNCESCGRILFHDPNRAAKESDRNRTGSYTIEKAWRYVADESGPGRFLAFVNAKHSCSMRIFDAATGQALDKVVKKKMTFKEAFRDELSAGVHLHIEQPNLDEECAVALPPEVLEELQLQAGIAPGASTRVSA